MPESKLRHLPACQRLLNFVVWIVFATLLVKNKNLLVRETSSVSKRHQIQLAGYIVKHIMKVRLFKYCPSRGICNSIVAKNAW